ncbi:MAG: hypothetical protein IKF48_03440, partial [Oscillospiraceae bacterium]|nr:hypothetical protein [Oscillospiraceae bacterium]
ADDCRRAGLCSDLFPERPALIRTFDTGFPIEREAGIFLLLTGKNKNPLLLSQRFFFIIHLFYA